MNKKLIMASILIGLLLLAEGYYIINTPSERINLVGQGSSFVYPLMSAWTCVFSKLRRNITVNYQSTGSGAGIRAILDGTVDFAASDAPMNHDEWSKARSRGVILQFPITIGAVVVAYNIPDIDQRIKLSGEILAKIYMGEISKWNDPEIEKINLGLRLPDKEIYVVKRSDGSGTTYVFTDFLSAVSVEWREKYGKTKIFQNEKKIGDRGISAKGNEGVAQSIQQTPYSIGYIELAYAIETGMSYALLQNRDGVFVDANTTTIASAAANAYRNLPDPSQSWENVTMVYQPGNLSYPISSFVYMIVYQNQTDVRKALALRDWISWILTSGQDFADDLLYVPLPENVREIGLSAAERITSASVIYGLSTISGIVTKPLALIIDEITIPFRVIKIVEK